MEPNESTRARTGEKIAFSGEYRARCCSVVKNLSQGQSFPECSEHGETVWSWIPPFVQSGYGTDALLNHWRSIQPKGLSFSDAFNSWRDSVSAATTPVEALGGVSASARVSALEPERKPLTEILLQAAIVVPGHRTTEGHIIEAVGPAWAEILKQLDRDPNILSRFREYPREFEELMAAAYKKAGWEIILTPRSNDKGRDVIASRHDFCSVRIFDQAKAYAPKRRVAANDVLAMVGILERDSNVSKGVVTTTSQFAPGIEKDENIKRFMPYRLELRNGEDLHEWLSRLYKTNS